MARALELFAITNTIIIMCLIFVIVAFNVKSRYLGIRNKNFDNTLMAWVVRISLVVCPVINVLTLIAIIYAFCLSKEQLQELLDRGDKND